MFRGCGKLYLGCVDSVQLYLDSTLRDGLVRIFLD